VSRAFGVRMEHDGGSSMFTHRELAGDVEACRGRFPIHT
jgi:hypothetical protein